MDTKISREFVTIPSFDVKWARLGLTDEDLRHLETEILKDPKIGPVIQGTGRARKVRFPFPNRGKSGSARVIYVDYEVYEKVYLLDVFAKSEKENLTKADRNDLKAVVDFIELALEQAEGK